MVDHSSISQMASIMEIINGKIPNNSSVTKDTESNTAAMKDILQKFSFGTNLVADNLINESKMDFPLREAIQTERTDDGVIIGSWKITVKKESGRSLYDVTHIDNTTIASDLTIYEAAKGLATALNNNIPITSPSIRELLKLEEAHANAVHDAIHAKYSLKKQKLTESRRYTIEDKYSAALRRAASARRDLLKLVENMPLSYI